MTTEQLPPQHTTPDQNWGAPQQRPPQRWDSRKTLAAVAVAVAVVGAGGAAIYVAGTSSDSSSSQGGMQGGPGGGQMPGGTSGASTLSSALHGEYVVSDGNGGYTTELMQTGTVTEISATSLTAKSTDGYTKTYTIDSGTAVGDNQNISSIATGDTVTVVASVSGDTATADTLTEGSDQAGQGAGGAPAGQQQQGTLPKQDSSSSGSGQTTGQG
ncbi:hypothetical protein FPZ12_034140 [Amycolatopsis acidicola]|uniref:DUF5666 domain-containing protein n=1 Tax=Amycolatopsis acidicola TaxID=2596893 RepID=A0A5N0URW8_9PSEU|nr:hypothetical protein [Amycolatopsis acidicola]KAA9153621.1 hypothetical protein FPZ12_034140 [Amycolatopsis acidicola]